jgi:L-ascorbate metabolism protein UlaG (beta-lactamase superfamily)
MTENITVNTQSSIRIDTGDLIIRADPFGLTEELHDADIILITHEHFDHFSPDDIVRVSKPDTVFAAPESMRKKLAGMQTGETVFLRPGDKTEIRGIPVEAVAAYNIMKPFHAKPNGWLGYIVTVGGKRIYAAGDTDATKEAKAVRCDIALVPVGGTYTMNAREAAALVNEIQPGIAIPIHYGSIVGSRADGEKFAGLVDGNIKVEMKLF